MLNLRGETLHSRRVDIPAVEVPEKTIEAMARVRLAAQEHLQAIDQRIAENQALRPEDREQIIQTARGALSASSLPESGENAPEVNDGPDA